MLKLTTLNTETEEVKEVVVELDSIEDTFGLLLAVIQHGIELLEKKKSEANQNVITMETR